MRSTLARTAAVLAAGVAVGAAVVPAAGAAPLDEPARPTARATTAGAAPGAGSGDTVARLIVKYRSGAQAEGDERVPGERAVRAAELRSTAALADGVSTVALTEPVDEATAARAARQLASDPRVAYAVPDLPVRAFSAVAPNDAYLSRQWPLVGAGGVRPQEAWRRTRGTGVVVAVLDSGITRHPDLDARQVPGHDFVSLPVLDVDSREGRDADPSDPGDAEGTARSSWHGTHVTGTVAAAADNGTGVVGLAPRARVQPVRVLGVGGAGVTADIVAGIRWAAGLPVTAAPATATRLRC